MGKTAPTWDLYNIYESFECENFKNDLIELEQLKKETNQLLVSKLFSTSFPQWVFEFIEKQNKLNTIATSLYAYSYASYSVDTTNSQLINQISNIEALFVEIKQINLKFSTAFSQVVTKNPQYLKDLYTTYPQLEFYSFILKEIIALNKHNMSPEKEALAGELNISGAESFSRLQEQLISNLVDTETGKSFNEIRNDAYDKNRSIRADSFKKEILLLSKMSIPFAACLNSIKGTTITLNKHRHWSSALNKALSQSRMNDKTLNALIEAIEDSIPFWQEYLSTKAQILFPNEQNPKIAFYDLFAPLQESGEISAKILPDSCTNLSAKIWSFEEAKQYIIDKFSLFSNDLGKFAENAFANNWIDAKIRSGKVGGAYCMDFPKQKVSRILSNFSGSFSDIITLAHELGHAYHFYCIKDRDFMLSQYPMTLAETASNFAETIIKESIISSLNGFERISMIELHLQDCCQLLIDILSRFYFERSVFENRQKGELSCEEFCNLMIEAQKKTYGNILSEYHPYMWALKSHYYGTDLDFYNFPYAFGMLFSAGLYARYKKEKSAFAETYKTILFETGRLSCEEICKKAGFDIETKEFWLSGIEPLKNQLDELKKYASSVSTQKKSNGN
ncbi:MAG: M3 family oligoendopeptidase [Treponema sp.]|jgi:pepF/M3 family oligoendopeptidase|nr:M3 family oligoendopeptidase [Treponema sp.]